MKAVHIDHLGVDFPHVKQAIKLIRWRQDTTTGKIGRETVYVITSLSSVDAGPQHLARIVREHWPVEVQHHVWDVYFDEARSTGRTGHGPVNLATLRAAIAAAIQDAGYLYIPRRPPRPHHASRSHPPTRPHLMKQGNHGLRRSPDTGPS